jgi:hypothetical protein
VRSLLAFLACASFAAAESHPSWWNYASPDATALVGIEWQTVRASPFAEAVEAELWGDLGFPDLTCLRNARQFVLSSPELLALVSGNFPSAAMRDQAAKKGMKAMTYRGVDMWFSTGSGMLSVARMNDQLAIIGDPKTLEIAVDRSIADSKNHSPLLARAAQFTQKDLWVVSTQLPDDLASRFVPLETEARNFEGWVSVRNGLDLEATFSAASERAATASAKQLREAIPAFPAIVHGLQVTVEGGSVLLALAATREQVVQALRGVPAEAIKVETSWEVPAPIVEKPVEKVPEKPQVIRIFGLDEGPREIVLPPVKPEK